MFLYILCTLYFVLCTLYFVLCTFLYLKLRLTFFLLIEFFLLSFFWLAIFFFFFSQDEFLDMKAHVKTSCKACMRKKIKTYKIRIVEAWTCDFFFPKLVFFDFTSSLPTCIHFFFLCSWNLYKKKLFFSWLNLGFFFFFSRWYQKTFLLMIYLCGLLDLRFFPSKSRKLREKRFSHLWFSKEIFHTLTIFFLNFEWHRGISQSFQKTFYFFFQT